MALTRNVIFLLSACACFVVALACSLTILHSNETAWVDGGLLSLALSFLP